MLIDDKSFNNYMLVIKTSREKLKRLQEENERLVAENKALKAELRDTREDHRAFLKATQGIIEHRLRLREAP